MQHSQKFTPRERVQRDVDKVGFHGGRDKWITPILKYIKILLWVKALEKGKSEAAVIHDSWKRLGLGQAALLQFIEAHVPDALLEAQTVLGADRKEFGKALYGRLFNMYNDLESDAEALKNKRRLSPTTDKPINKRVPMVGKEHPTRSPRLRPYYVKAVNLYNEGGMPTRAQVEEVFK